MLLILLRHPDAGVFNNEEQLDVMLQATLLLRNREGDTTTLRRVLNCIRQYIDEHLLQTGSVSHEFSEALLRARDQKFLIFLLALRFYNEADAVYNLAQGELLANKHHLAAFDS